MTDGLMRFTKGAVREVIRTVRHGWNALTDAKPKLLVLAYHRVLPEAGFNPLETVIDERTFIKQLTVIARRYPIQALGAIMTRDLRDGRRGRPDVVLTFDDGYWDHHGFVLPVLKRLGLPATFFVPTDYIGAEQPPWDWELMRRLTDRRDVSLVMVGEERLKRRPGESPRRFAWRVVSRVKSASREIQTRVLEPLRPRATNGQPRMDRCMTWEEVRSLAKAGMEISSHAMSHRSLSRLAPREASDEIRQSKARIEHELQQPCRHFAFPFGSPRDYNDRLVVMVREAGYATCSLNIHGYTSLEEGFFTLKRIIMRPSSNPATLLG